jgi:hypothetical protein
VAVEEDFEVSGADPRDNGAQSVEEDLVEAQRFVFAANPFAAVALFAALGGDCNEISEKTDNLFLIPPCRIQLTSSCGHAAPLAARSPVCTIVRSRRRREHKAMRNPEQVLDNTIQRCRERDIIIPTYREMADPTLIPEGIREELADIGLWDVHSRNLYRISWKNEPVDSGGGYGGVNFVELPSELTGVEARIFILLGKFFPTGAHKVGATFGPLVEKLVRGAFDPTTQKALWPSTGNYCRGGAYDAALLSCPSIAVLPEGMSRERFEWLEKMGSEIFRRSVATRSWSSTSSPSSATPSGTTSAPVKRWSRSSKPKATPGRALRASV